MIENIRYQVADDYIVGLRNGENLPIKANFPVDDSEANVITVKAATEVSEMLTRKGFTVITLGSVSVERHLQEQYQGRRLHDIDYALPGGQIESAKKELRSAGFAAWNEREILATVRNSGGGFGRVHNEGGASDQYLNPDTGLPIWFGMFAFDEKNGGTEFHEYYTVTEHKVKSTLTWLQSQEIAQTTKNQIAQIDSSLDVSSFEQLESIFQGEGLSFWDVLFSPQINEEDIQRRQTMGCDQADKIFELKMTKLFPTNAKDYFGATTATGYEGDLSVFSLEGAYMLVDKYYPHYLGIREKYQKASDTIKNSGLLNAEKLGKYQELFAKRQVKHEATQEIQFQNDIIQDPETLIKQPNVQSIPQDEVFYPALLFEDIHVKRFNEV